MSTFRSDDQTTHSDLDECQGEVEDLRAALRTRPAIDQAKGILMAKHGCTPDAAYQMLRSASQRDNRKLHELAKSIVDGVQDEDARKEAG